MAETNLKAAEAGRAETTIQIPNLRWLISERSVASVAGLGGTGAGIGSMVFVLATGWVVDHFGYAPILTAAGVLAPIGTVVLFALMGKVAKVES
ncbi:MAG: hypothetical protein ACREEM_53080 [Blastocatellia bacterium]